MPSDPATAAAAHPLLVLPFVLLPGAIAVTPFVDPPWWERHYAKVSVALGGAVRAVYYLFWLALLTTALGRHGLGLDSRDDVARFVAGHPGALRAISLGAVFFGAMTYIGNGPNFTVRAVAEQAQVRPPGFFRYLRRYSPPVLVPTFFLISLLFFSRWRVF